MKPGSTYAFPKKMRLSSRKEIESLFTDACSFTTGPFRLFYRTCDVHEPDQPKTDLPETEKGGCSLVFSVPKKNLKSAVKRNLIKRRLRESFRLHYPRLLKPVLEATGTRLVFLCIYLPHEVRPFSYVETKMQVLLGHFAQLSEKGSDFSPDLAG